jgi:selenide,water dikinase
VLRHLPQTIDERILVGLETSDDAGVIRLDADHALIQTLDFFTPIVDDPYEYGQVAAANSLSDVYAMGGVPLTAMNIVCYPMNELPHEWLVEILRGGSDKVREAGALLLGGHTVNDPEIKFGLSVTGVAHPAEVTANRGARPGDDLVLTKALGTGIVTTALKGGTASPAEVEAVTASMKTLNGAAARAMVRTGVHAATDITGFGLLGHLYEMLAASEVAAEIEARSLPLLPGALEHAAAGVNTGGGRTNAEYLAPHVRMETGLSEPLQAVLFDPQTSGGLLMAVAPERTGALLEELAAQGVNVRAVIGKVTGGEPGRISVRGA